MQYFEATKNLKGTLSTEQNNYYDFNYDNGEIQRDDEEFAKRIAARRRMSAVKRRRKKALTVLILIAAFAFLATMCGKDIVRLQAENRALKKQQAELEKQRDELKEELSNADTPEYIREQARRQLRLLNPGEILFTFDEDEEAAAEAEEGTEENTEENSKNKSDKKGKSEKNSKDKSDKKDKSEDSKDSAGKEGGGNAAKKESKE